MQRYIYTTRRILVNCKLFIQYTHSNMQHVNVMLPSKVCCQNTVSTIIHHKVRINKSFIPP